MKPTGNARGILPICLPAALFFALCLATPAAAEPTGITVEEARQAERDRYAALNSNNLEELSRLVGDDLVYIHSSGVVDDKTAWLESLRSGRVRYLASTLQESKVRTYGNTAIVTGLVTLDLTVGGDPRSVTLYFTAVYVKQSDGIKFVSWNSTRKADA